MDEFFYYCSVEKNKNKNEIIMKSDRCVKINKLSFGISFIAINLTHNATQFVYNQTSSIPKFFNNKKKKKKTGDS